jgi:RHS repeat-associated protein
VIAGRDHKYGYNAKEEQEELGLDWLDITARNYDPALGRWMNIDPLAEQMPEWSPYNYAFDNPIKFHDPDGRAPSGGCPPGDPDCGQNENNSTEPIEKAVEVTAKAVKEKTIEAVLYAAPLVVTATNWLIDNFPIKKASGRERTDSDGYDLKTDSGEKSGDASTKAISSGDVDPANVTGFVQLGGFVGPKLNSSKSNKGQGTTKKVENFASVLLDGFDNTNK